MDDLNVCRKMEMAMDAICNVIAWPNEPDKLAFIERSWMTMTDLTNSLLNLAKARERMGNVYPNDGFGDEPVVSEEMMSVMEELNERKKEADEREQHIQMLLKKQRILEDENAGMKKVLTGQRIVYAGTTGKAIANDDPKR